ncbi:MAG: hypothetical protein ACKVT1_07925 [Dehalococcoidia bacterium]
MNADEAVRFADVLTTASAIANYHGLPDVTAVHLLDAIAVLRGAKSMADLGRPVSPLVPRSRTAAGGVEPAVKALIQRWHARLGSPGAVLSEDALAQFAADLHALAS